MKKRFHLPKKASVCGVDYLITGTTPERDKGLKGLAGYCDTWASSIVIDRTMSPELQFQVLCHELAHATFESSGAAYIIRTMLEAAYKTGKLDWVEFEEHLVRTMLQGYTATLKANGMLVPPQPKPKARRR